MASAFSAALILACACGSLALAAALPKASREMRVAAVAYRLGVGALPWCDDPVRLPGWQLRYLDDYDLPLRADLAAVFAMDRGPNLLATVPGGPAALAGLRESDTIVGAVGRPLPALRAPGERVLATALNSGPARLDLSRAGDKIAVSLDGTPGCAATVRIVPIARRNAYADGASVIVSTRIVDLARDDGELAALLAHELAHNYLHHGVATPAAPPLPLLRAEEHEADRFSLVLMAAAGYDLAAAPRFWSRLLRDSRDEAHGYGTHDPRRQRLAAFEAEIAKLRATPSLEWKGVAAPVR